MMDINGTQFPVQELHTIDYDSHIGFVVDDYVFKKVRNAVARVLIENKDLLVAYDWTLNHDYKDTSQVTMAYTDANDYRTPTEERLDGFMDCDELRIIKTLYTAKTDREAVSRLCSDVAKAMKAEEPKND